MQERCEKTRRTLRKQEVERERPEKERKLAAIKSCKFGGKPSAKSSLICSKIKDNLKSLKYNEKRHNFLKAQSKSIKSKGLKAECRIMKKNSPIKKALKKTEQKG